MLSVRYNRTASRATANLHRTQSELSDVLGQLSTGRRINRAADDPAGLAIATNIQIRIRSAAQSMRNTSDGISMIQTAEGAMNTVADLLTRMRELATQSASETLADTDRLYVNDELEQLVDEVTRIADSAEFNGVSLLRGVGSLSVQVGPDNNGDNRFDIALANMAATALGLGGIDLRTVSGARTALDQIDVAIDLVNGARSRKGAEQNRLDSALRSSVTSTEALSSSGSQIMDLDYARAASRLARLQIMQQAGTAALVQARDLGRSIVSLL